VLPRFLVDTHILLHWRSSPGKLSKEQIRLIRAEEEEARPLALSAITLIELALLISEGRLRIMQTTEQFFSELEENPAFRVLPITFEIAAEFASVGSALRDPAGPAWAAPQCGRHLRAAIHSSQIRDSFAAESCL